MVKASGKTCVTSWAVHHRSARFVACTTVSGFAKRRTSWPHDIFRQDLRGQGKSRTPRKCIPLSRREFEPCSGCSSNSAATKKLLSMPYVTSAFEHLSQQIIIGVKRPQDDANTGHRNIQNAVAALAVTPLAVGPQ